MPGCARKVAAGETLGRGCVTVIGDAAHPTTPALGQVRAFYACAYASHHGGPLAMACVWSQLAECS